MAVGVSDIGNSRGVMAGEAARLAAGPLRGLCADVGGVPAAVAEHTTGRELSGRRDRAGDGGETAIGGLQVGGGEQPLGVAVARASEDLTHGAGFDYATAV